MAQITGCARNTAPAGTWTLDIQDQSTQIKVVLPQAELKKIIVEMGKVLVVPNTAFHTEISKWLNTF